MRRRLILLFILLTAIPLSVQAQGNVALDSLNVRLWSEYDQPSMLVIYDFIVTDDTRLPATVDIRIPADGNIIAAAYEEGDTLLNADFKGPVEDGSWQIITFFIQTQTTYHLEYYQPLTRDGNLRTFNYRWAGEYAVNDFSIEIQVPQDSTGTKTSPTIPFVQDQPFLSGGAMKEGLEAGQTYQLQLQYSRTNEDTVVPSPASQVEPAEPLDTTTEGRATLDNLPYILGGIGAVLIVAALYYSWRANSFQLPKPRRRTRQIEKEREQVYCHECGTRAHPGDRFCRTCGVRLHI